MAEGAFSSLLLLTDGVPNQIPPRGHVPSLQRYLAAHPNAQSTKISTFGFGYSLDSEMLADLAASTGGINIFIPDATFVGTTFINCVCTLLTECARSVTLEVPGGVISDSSTPNGLWKGPKLGGQDQNHFRIPAGSVHIGYHRDIIIRLNAGTNAASVAASMTISYRTTAGEIAEATNSGQPPSILATEESVIASVIIDACQNMHDAIHSASRGEFVTARRTIASAVTRVHNALRQHHEISDAETPDRACAYARLCDFHTDLSGQISLALSREDWFKRWGVHYLRSILQAHLHQICTNFKDPGLQRFGGDLFRELRDIGEEIFLALPPPTPSLLSHGRRQGSPATSMRAYHSSDGVCFTGDCLVTLYSGQQVRADEIRAGSAVRSGGPTGGSARVKCVVRTDFPRGFAELVRLPGGLCITPWHPVWIGGRWAFPGKMASPEILPCRSVYSFVLEGSPSCLVSGYSVVGLGHGISGDPVASHAYFGCPSYDKGVLRDLSSLSQWGDGLIVLEGGRCILRAQGEKVNRISQIHSTSSVHGYGSHEKGDIIGIYAH